jgi:polyhydroxyalkanoate synthesis repressor PhaR
MADSTARAEPAPEPPASTPVVVKKYANRRLYNTESSSYVTLEDLAGMVRQGRDFVVYDAKSGEEITRSVLTQIIVEEESKGRNLLPEGFLRHLIGFYGDSLQTVLPRYLDVAMNGFARQQTQMRHSMEQAMGGLMPFPTIEEVSKQNMAMMERAMNLFSPFRQAEPPQGGHQGAAQTIEALKAEVESLRQQLATLQQSKPDASRTG